MSDVAVKNASQLRSANALARAGRPRVHDQRAGAAVRLRKRAHPFELEEAALEIERAGLGPGAPHRAEPLLGIVVARLVIALLDAEHLEFALVPSGDDVQRETALADVVGGDELLRGNDRMEQRRVDGAEHGDALGRLQQAAGPGHRLQRRAVEIGVAAVAFPAADRQHEIDAGFVGHRAEREAIRPARGPALRRLGRGARRRAVRAEHADLERVGVVHRQALFHRSGRGQQRCLPCLERAAPTPCPCRTP